MHKNETLILFFEKKDFYVRVIVGSLSLVYFLLNIIIASSLLLEESCSADTLLFSTVPPHITFFETF